MPSKRAKFALQKGFTVELGHGASPLIVMKKKSSDDKTLITKIVEDEQDF